MAHEQCDLNPREDGASLKKLFQYLYDGSGSFFFFNEVMK